MASTASAAPTSSLGASNQQPTSTQKDVPSKAMVKNTGSGKMSERARKESPVDNGRRPQPKAWTLGSNPITQRGSLPTQANGNTIQSKGAGTSKSVTPKDVGLSEKHGHDRLRYLLAAATGLSVIFTTKTGDKFEGIFAGSVTVGNSTKITLKMTRKVQNNLNQINGVAAREAALVGTSPEHAMTFDFRDMADLIIPEFSLPETTRHVNGASTAFQTDTDISGNAVRSQRVLQKWEPEGPVSADFSLEAGSAGTWDQFATHNQMFGDKSTYDENLYTTEIDRRAPGYKQREAEAARIAREIEGSVSTNAHVREERGQINEQDHEDEESKYSGVRRDESNSSTLTPGVTNKYTPPARRAPTAVPTVAGAPFDSAIISAQLSKPDGPKQVPPKENPDKITPSTEVGTVLEVQKTTQESQENAESSSKSRTINASGPAQAKPNVDNPTEDVEVKVLDQFRQFANSERARIAEKRRAQATHDRTAKLNDLLRFSKTFKLKTPIPSDLVGILAKDPAKQEAIIEKAQKDSEESKSAATVVSSPPAQSTTTTASASSAKTPPVPKFDASQVPPPIPERSSFNKGRIGYAANSVRGERQTQQPTQVLGRGAPPFVSRTSGGQERKGQAPAPIPLPEGRTPPIGPMAEQNVLNSPQRSTMHTPTSALATKMNARAMEFRPTAPSFNPSAPSNAPSSPASVQRTGSTSRAASPSSFFGSRRPRSSAERPSVSANFNSIKRMRQETAAKKTGEKTEEPVKDYAFNGGIPNAYHTGPVWVVKDENKNKTYLSAFERPGMAASPAQTRNTSAHHTPYQHHMPPANGTVPHISTPQHGPHAPHHYGHHFDDHRTHLQGGSPQVFASPGMSSRQMSNFTSPGSHQAQLAYGQPHYYGGSGGQIPLQMRQFPNAQGMIHAQPGQMTAPLMVQQASSGPYMTVPQGYGQMQMYSPSPAHAYPQQNGYPSPGRVAPMMMQQGSQHSHHGGQQVMYAMQNQSGPMIYPQQGQMSMIRGGYGGPQAPYGPNLHQSHHMQQRAMSTGYGQKSVSQAMHQTQGPPSNAPQQPAAYSQMEMSSEDAK